MNTADILKKYYTDAEDKVYPGFFDSDDAEADLIPGYENEYSIYGIYEAKPQYLDILSKDGYNIVYRIIGNHEDFIGVMISGELYDVTDDILQLVDEDYAEESMSYESDDRLAYGKKLYDAYGPDIDPYDLDEYDAECYLAYRRSI